MNAADVFLLTLIPVTLVVSAVCSASETSLFLLGHNDKLRLKRQHPGAFAAVTSLLARPRRLLVTILVFNTIANTAFFVATSLLDEDMERGIVKVLLASVAPAVLLVVGEVLPKTLASIHRVKFVRVISMPLLAVSRVAAPVMSAIDRGVVAPLTRLVRPRGPEHPEPIGAEELSALVQLGVGQGVLDADEEHLLAEVVELGLLRVRDVMTPRVDIRWVAADAGRAGVIEAVRESGHAKLPVFEASPDEPSLGWLNARRYLAACEGGVEPPMLKFVEPVHYVPERIKLDQLLDHFRATHTHIALCVTEHGAITGLIEVADAVKGLIGTGGAGSSAESEQIRMVGLGTWIVPGRLSVRDWAQLLGRSAAADVRFETGVSTLGGLIVARLGRVPRVGDAVRVANIRLQVESMSGRVVDTARVSLTDSTGTKDGLAAAGREVRA